MTHPPTNRLTEITGEPTARSAHTSFDRRRGRGRLSITLLTAAGLMLTGLGPGAAAEAAPGDPVIDIVDTGATAETMSLYSYLQDQMGHGVLFGHQHTTDNGITFTEADGTKSDVFAGTGEYPAIFGWDTLILEGKESPGVPTNTLEQNVEAFASGMVNAHELGGINTISAHMRNFVTGNDFTDSSGRVVSQILPGAPRNAEFNAYLDLVAATADATVDSTGTPIPIVFRPFHENTGSWFWWGAAHATTGEYKEIFRYTVEYLRDTKGVDNLLYAFSPNGVFGGDAARYLDTYPGDNWVDILGYDSYDYDNAPENSDTYIETVRVDLAMVTDLAAERGKIAAFTEFGRNGDRTIRPSGNRSLTFYTDLLEAIKNDPEASRIAYMQTWSNWEPGQFYVPYPTYDGNPEHEMYQDFLAFYNDPFTVFSADVTGVDDNAAQAEPAETTLRFVSPADGVRLTEPTTTLRVKATEVVPQRVYVTVGDDPAQIELTLDGDYWTAEWATGGEQLTNRPETLNAYAEYDGATTLEAESSVILGESAELPLGVVDDFDSYGSEASGDAALRAAYSYNNATSADISLLDQGEGDSAVQFAYDFTSRSYGGFGKVFTDAQDWSGFNQVNAWLDPDASGQKLVLQVNTANGQSFEAYPSLAGDEPTELAIDILDFRAKSDPDRSLTATDLVGVKEFWVYINQAGDPVAGSIAFDDIRAVSGDAEPTLPGTPEEPPVAPGLVDDFEGYADDAALRAAWSRAGAAALSLSLDVKASGEYGGAFPFTPAFDEFQKSVNADWSEFDQLSMWIQPDATEQKVVLQLVAAGNYYDAVVVAGGSEVIEATIPWSQFTPAPFQDRDPELRPTPAELADVQQLVMFIEPTENSTSESGTLHFDDIRATSADVVEPEPEPAASQVSVGVSPRVVFCNQRPTVRVTVRSEGESVPAGEVVVQAGREEYTAELDDRGTAKVRLPRLRPGLHVVRVSYGGDEVTEGSQSRPTFVLALCLGRRGDRP